MPDLVRLLAQQIEDILLEAENDFFLDEKQESLVFHSIIKRWKNGDVMTLSSLKEEFPFIKNTTVVLNRINDKISSLVQNNESFVVRPVIETFHIKSKKKRMKGIRLSIVLLGNRITRCLLEDFRQFNKIDKPGNS